MNVGFSTDDTQTVFRILSVYVASIHLTRLDTIFPLMQLIFLRTLGFFPVQLSPPLTVEGFTLFKQISNVAPQVCKFWLVKKTASSFHLGPSDESDWRTSIPCFIEVLIQNVLFPQRTSFPTLQNTLYKYNI